jgi:hypothetical protein
VPGQPRVDPHGQRRPVGERLERGSEPGLPERGRGVAGGDVPRDGAAGRAGNPGIRAYERPDTTGAVSLAWDDFEVRRASLAKGGG